MQPSPETEAIPPRLRWAAALIAIAISLLLADPAAAAPSCHGIKATIVSNGPVIVGTKGHDVIVAGPGKNKIYGEGGNDLVCAGAGEDTIYGGRGNDTMHGEGGEDTVYGERGSDHLYGDGDTDALFGETGNDTLDGGGGEGDRLSAGPGDDSLDGGAGDFDTMVGGPGNDKVDGGPGAHDIASYAGTGGGVTIDLQAQSVGGAEGEHLNGIEDAVGGSGDDTLIGGGGTPNRLDGGPGDDRLVSSGPGDEAFGGPGSDRCEEIFAVETSCGPSEGSSGTAVELYESIDGASSLIVAGSNGVDAAAVSFSGGAYVVRREPGGAAILLGDPGSGACTGDPLGEWVSCQGRVASILAPLGAGDDRFTVTTSVPTGVFSIVEGGNGSDAIRGGRGDDVLYSGDDHDADALEGGGGDDVLYGVNIFHPRKDSGAAKMVGGPGNDLMIGGQPCDGDLFDGGPGSNDSASFARVRNSGTFVRAVIGGAVLDPDVSGCDAGRIDLSVEKIEGSPGPDVLLGDNSANVLLGRGGNDRLEGRGANDTCIGGGGRDQASSCEQTSSVS